MSGDDGIGADDGVEAAAKINVRVVNGRPFNLSVKLNSTVEEFRNEITENCAIRDDRLLLIYKDRIMTDGLTLQSYGVEDGETVDAVEFRDARTVIDNATEQLQMEEDLVENLEDLDLSAVENMVNDPEFLLKFNMDNAQMIEICDRTITVLSQVNDRLITLRNSAAAAAGSSHASTSADPPPPPQVVIALNPPLHSVLLSNQLVRDILQKSETARMALRGQTSREAAQNEGGTISAEERYASQLAQLKTLNFNDVERNIRALNATEGDLIAAVHALIGLGDTIL